MAGGKNHAFAAETERDDREKRQDGDISPVNI